MTTLSLLAATAALFGTAAEPPKATATEVVSISSPGGWRLYIRDDGSANLRYGADSGNGYTAPAGTFDAEKVRKALDALKSEPKAEGRHRTHFLYWFESERAKAPHKEPPSRYTQDESLVVPLFEKAAVASRLKDTARGKELLKEKPFGLPPEAKLKNLYTLRTPSGWMLRIRNDGSGQLVFGAGGGGDNYVAPAGTFKPDEVRKSLDGLKLDPKGGEGSHFVVWYEEERKAPADGPPARYTRDETVVVALFEKAAEACKGKPGDRPLGALGSHRPAFGLKK